MQFKLKYVGLVEKQKHFFNFKENKRRPPCWIPRIRKLAAKRGSVNCRGCREEVAIFQDGVVLIWWGVFSNAGIWAKYQQNFWFSFDWFNVCLLFPADAADWTTHLELRIRRKLSETSGRSVNKAYRLSIKLNIITLAFWRFLIAS